MSTPVETATLTIAQRNTKSTRELWEALELGTLSPANMKYLVVALTEAATDEVRQNVDFADRVRNIYASLLPKKASRGAVRQRTGGPRGVKLVPIGTVDEALFDPYAPPSPFALRLLYGDAQLAAALERYSVHKLKEAVLLVQERYPETKPKQMTKAGIVAYIVHMLTERSTQ